MMGYVGTLHAEIQANCSFSVAGEYASDYLKDAERGSDGAVLRAGPLGHRGRLPRRAERGPRLDRAMMTVTLFTRTSHLSITLKWEDDVMASMFERIVVPIDESDPSRAASRLALGA